MWQKAHTLVLDVYRFSATFPDHETYGLRAQLRRAAVSIPANIAEGFKRNTPADKARIMNIAQASLEEVRYYFLLVQDLNYGDPTGMRTRAEEVAKLLSAYCRKVRVAA